MQLPARFICCDLYDPRTWMDFDIVYTSTGAHLGCRISPAWGEFGRPVT